VILFESCTVAGSLLQNVQVFLFFSGLNPIKKCFLSQNAIKILSTSLKDFTDFVKDNTPRLPASRKRVEGRKGRMGGDKGTEGRRLVVLWYEVQTW